MIQTAGQTTNFTVQYEDSIPNAVRRATALLSIVETEFSVLTNWFAVDSGKFGPDNRIKVILNRSDNSGARTNGYKSSGNSTISLDAQSAALSDDNATEIVSMLFVAEFVEILMDVNAKWNRADSAGEGLSHLCDILRFRNGHYLYYGVFVNPWLQSSSRTDWITNSRGIDTDQDSFGCALLFLYYLIVQLGYRIPVVIQTPGNTLEDKFLALTGRRAGYAEFRAIVNRFFPIGNTPLLSMTDNIFPLWDYPDRDVTVSAEERLAGPVTTIGTGTVAEHFFGCPEKDYSFEIKKTPKVLTCVATPIGFGQPRFRWQINGVNVPMSGTISPMIRVTLDNQTDPRLPGVTRIESVPISCLVTTTPFSSTLRLETSMTLGHFDLDIAVLASERFGSMNETAFVRFVRIDDEQAAFELAYYDDSRHCKDKFLSKLRGLAKPFDKSHKLGLLLSLPDPPPEFTAMLKILGDAAAEMKGIAKKSPAKAKMLEQGIERAFDLPPGGLAKFHTASRKAIKSKPSKQSRNGKR